MTTNTSNKIAKFGEDEVFEDKISNLPDVILSHILSFISTREAVRTSTLAKRWNSVWPSVPVLNVNEYDIYKKDIFPLSGDPSIKALRLSFAEFLDKVIVDHKMPYLETITILNSSSEDSSRVKVWLCALANRNMRELFLEHTTSSYQIAVLPKALFASKNLVVLKLHVALMVDVPADCACLPSLKVLELRKVIYNNDDAAKNLISGCPVLEDLAITRGNSDNLATLTVSSVVLKNLKVSCRESGGEEKKLVIDAPALESVDIFDCVTDEYEVASDLSSVVKAKLHVSDSFSASDDSESFETCLYELLEKISNVNRLSFSSYTMQSLSYCESYDLPKFQYLTSFELYARTKVKKICWGLMIEILFSSPALESITFMGFEFSWEGKSSICHCDMPDCLKTSLKTITIIGLTRVYDIRNLTYFLENGLVMEKLIIDNRFWNEEFRSTVAAKLSNIRKASTACQFVFC